MKNDKNFIMIAHRGNTEGPKPEQENSPEYIEQALADNFYVEVDVHLQNGLVLLGHDQKYYMVTADFLNNDRILCHAKNFEAVEYFYERPNIHWFWHDNDKCTLTSRGWVWTYPWSRIKNSILNQPEFYNKTCPQTAIDQYKSHIIDIQYAGVCSDYVKTFRDLPRE